MLNIIGAGVGRTGTLSLKTALETLGFGPCHHMFEVVQNPQQIPLWRRAGAGEPVDWEKLFHGYRSTVDWPGARFWRTLVDRYPDAKVILTERDPRSWYESARDSVYESSMSPLPEGAPPYVDDLRAMTRALIWEGVFDGRFSDPDHAIEVFNRHNEAVRRGVPADRLLVYQVSQGWGPLCDFLNVPVPDEPFPRLNERAAFHEMIRTRLSELPR